MRRLLQPRFYVLAAAGPLLVALLTTSGAGSQAPSMVCTVAPASASASTPAATPTAALPAGGGY